MQSFGIFSRKILICCLDSLFLFLKKLERPYLFHNHTVASQFKALEPTNTPSFSGVDKIHYLIKVPFDFVDTLLCLILWMDPQTLTAEFLLELYEFLTSITRQNCCI